MENQTYKTIDPEGNETPLICRPDQKPVFESLGYKFIDEVKEVKPKAGKK